MWIIAQVAESVSDSTSVVSGWWVPIVALVLTAIAYQLVRLIKKGGQWLENKFGATEAEKEMMLNLQEGIAFAQDEMGRELKKAASDGKVTKEEAAQLKALAIKHAMDIGRGPAFTLMKEVGVGRLGALIEMLLSKFKPN